ncbi:bifunctional transcriptional activator/DNA repair enzyme AdaA [Adhaeribacter pallidiroseus]|uniref:methylated-DNA--[protein]-cysteine S-methyltransferase n=1 Tax=Adhaeribacter pallidiroseus TaxID=2072847 RepID=A0A369QHG7_9BACT|nr:trifunctional transcriptional activator/DNA repair protein Ada/methylated-DNA--[protein]-cysteine S-methyltransferase [Adhaeribacter pallidiroseus]RDC61738.1 Methylated-DNA--[protein]-cysteine S-methyltransferase [Adhaeribacter pallidiroseus]
MLPETQRNLNQQEIFYQALVAKDVTYEGTFIAAVKTTGIFCRPTCTARKPKIANVTFFKTTKEAILHGYRPCKVCKPLENLGESPAYVKVILQAIHADPSQKLKDWDLVQRGIEPNTIRRWFLKNHGLTFQAYQRLFRINSAFKKIQNGEKVTATAFDVGYDSLSGFSDSFKTIFGVAPTHSKKKQVIDIIRLETPLGTMLAGAVPEGVCLLEFTDRKMLETELKQLSKLLNATIIQGANAHFSLLQEELTAYFAGKQQSFTVPLVTPGTKFQQTVWQELQNIPYGTTRSYKQQAMALQVPQAVRAVAHANGMNRISILIPCHRVIGENGNLTGYGGGLWRKQWLINLEKENRLLPG